MIIKPGLYLHYKNKKYRVLGTGKDSDTFEEFVIYEARYNNPKSKLWVKKKTSFLEEVEINGKKVPRFKFIS